MRYTTETHTDDNVILMDSVSEIEEGDAHKIVIGGSHCSSNVTRYIFSVPLEAAVFNDAGVGKDNAGISSLPAIGEQGLPAVTVSHMSARIGDARDVYENGEISVVNAPAEALGVHPGMTTKQFIEIVSSKRAHA